MLLIYHSALDESGAALRRRRRLFRQGRGKSRAAVVWTEAEEGLKLMGNGSRPTKTGGRQEVKTVSQDERILFDKWDFQTV